MRGANPAYVNDVAGTSVRLAEANLNEIYHVAGPVAMSSFDLKVMLKKAFHAACPGGCSWIREISVSKEASLGYFAVVCETQATIAWPVRSWEGFAKSPEERL
jgi:dTDP-4-dehydrorhamnose reductase